MRKGMDWILIHLRCVHAFLFLLILPSVHPAALPFNPFFSNWFRSRAGPGTAYITGFGTESSRRKDGAFLSPEDFNLARNSPVELPSFDALDGNPEFFEGDIAGVASHGILHDAIDINKLPLNSALNLGTYPDKLWPQGRIPYVLEDGLEEQQRIAVAQAFEEYNNKTCVSFVPRKDDDHDYIFIRRNKNMGCSSYVGRAGGNQTISLEVGKCFTKGIVAHELMHSLGFFHEHSRTDRDKFVNIVEDNVKPGMLRNFEKYPVKIIDTLDAPYDYGSVMHYHKLAFSKNGKSTIVPMDPEVEIGQRYKLSEIDASKVNKLYHCTEDGEKSTTTKEKRSCKDLNEHCSMWSEIGHCKWSEKYMSHYCKSSCGLCKTEKDKSEPDPIKPSGSCLDQNLFCGYWARIGECKSESKFMKIFCKRSCDLCSKSNP